LSTASGANITLEGGNITVQCPGTITVKAGTKSFAGGANQDYTMPTLPQQICVDCLLSAAAAGSPFVIQ
jgi:type VI secretion system secreted protein VgrG